MNQYQEEIREKIKDILSILNLLETDMEQQNVEETYLRTIKLIHKMIVELVA